MTDVNDRLVRVLRDVVPEPPRELDASSIRSSAARRPRRRHLLAPALAAAAVVAVGVLVAVPKSATPRQRQQQRQQQQQQQQQQQPGRQRSAVPSPPAGFTASEFRLASPFGYEAIGPAPLPRATCTPQQISATAATRRTDGGVLGAIRLVGAVISHRYGVAERCSLPIARGPSALVAANGRRLSVPLSHGDPTDPPSNARPDLALNNGDAIWGFAWLGSYCGAPADAIEIPLGHAATGSLRIPLHGPQPRCDRTTPGSTLIDGIPGHPGQPVQPPPPAYASLRLSGQIEPGTTGRQLAPIHLTLGTTGTAPVTLDPCPAYVGRGDVITHSGGFSDPLSSGYLPCTARRVVIRPGHPLHWTIPATSLVQTPGTGAIPGSTVHVEVGIAGVPLLHLKTTAHG